MPPVRLVSPIVLAATVLLAGAPGRAMADGEPETHHRIWRDCLSRTFRIQVALTGRDLAADVAFAACRGAEAAYLATLARSPLLDADDIARARPLLADRNRAWLVGRNG